MHKHQVVGWLWVLGVAIGIGACGRHDGGKAGPAGHGETAAQVAPELVELENRAVGLMGQFDFPAAVEAFSRLDAKLPDGPAVKVNLAIATLNRQREGDSAAAMGELEEALRRGPDDLRARYCKGILLLNGGRPSEAMAEFEFVARRDRSDAYAVYYVGQCRAALARQGEALAAYEEAARLDPYLRSAYYGAFQVLQAMGKTKEAREHLAEFQRLKDNPQARLVEFKYTRMGPKAEAVVTLGTEVKGPATRPVGAVFADAEALPVDAPAGVVWGGGNARQGVTAADINGDGRVDLFITGALRQADGRTLNAVLLQQADGRFRLDVGHPLSAVADVNAAIWGDFDNDGLTDVYVARRGGNQLWRQTKAGAWADVTEATGTAGGGGETVDGAMVDADHDGDLDLVLVNRDGACEILNNDGNGKFRPIGKQSGFSGDGRGGTGLVVADLDSDRDVDLMVLKGRGPHEVFLNDRLWRYRAGKEFAAMEKTPITAAVAADADADGQVEVYAASADGAIARWTRGQGGQWEAHVLVSGGAAADRLAVADVDGTGRLSLIASRGGRLSAWVLPEGTEVVVPGGTKVGAWAVVTAGDPGKGPVVVGMPQGGGPPVIWRAGSGRFPFMTVSLSGRDDRADQMRSNASGVGVKLAARVGARWEAVETYRAQSGPGQSVQPVALGLGGAGQADFVRLTWPDGLMQTELSLRAGEHHRIAETQRQTSSCPVLFAWDGTKYAFVTDCLGVGGIGFAVAPGEYAPARPWENLMLPAGLPVARGGGYEVKLGEPMEEACYLDSIALVAYDLPPGWSMTLDDRMAVGGPEPTGAARFYRRAMSPSRATDDRGNDVTRRLAAADGVAAGPGEVDRRFIGLTRRSELTLEFAEAIDGAAGEPALVAEGWVEYPYSQTAFAAWQAGVAYEAPTLEARGADGRWVVVAERFGYPAGMPREMSVPIARETLPKGTRALRLRGGTQEIYWDRLRVVWCEACPGARRVVMPLARAEVREVGFARRTTGAQRRPSYDYERRVPIWDVQHQDGFYTAFGPADELVRRADSALAIFGPGEEVDAEFEAVGAGPAAGWERRFVVELTGWCKDRDLYTRDGETVEPVPHREGATAEELRRRDALHARYNTRYRSGG